MYHYDSQKEALEKLISNAEATRWVKLMGDLSMLFDLDPTRYKINKEDWIAVKSVPLEDFLDKLYEVIKNDN
jgi:signal transduction histidine kinase